MRLIERARAALPAPLEAVRPWAEEGGSAMDVAAEGGAAARRGGGDGTRPRTCTGQLLTCGRQGKAKTTNMLPRRAN